MALNEAVISSALMSPENINNLNIKRTPIISYGIVKSVLEEGIVQVALSVYPVKNAPKVINCIYANLASTNFAVRVKPSVNDKVIVLFMQYFDSSMFDVSKNEPICNPDSASYSYNTGIAIPVNQFQSNTFKNYFDASDGNLTLSFNNGNSVTLNGDGIKVKDKNNNEVTMSSSGIVVKDKNDNKIEMTSSGMTLEDKNGCKVEMTSTGTLINGKLRIAN